MKSHVTAWSLLPGCECLYVAQCVYEYLSISTSPLDPHSFPPSWRHSPGLASCTPGWCHTWRPHLFYDPLMTCSDRSSPASASHSLANPHPVEEGPDWRSNLRGWQTDWTEETLVEWACAHMHKCVCCYLRPAPAAETRSMHLWLPSRQTVQLKPVHHCLLLENRWPSGAFDEVLTLHRKNMKGWGDCMKHSVFMRCLSSAIKTSLK